MKQHVKPFNKFIAEGEADMAKPLASEVRPDFENETGNDIDKAFSEIIDKVDNCVTTLENLFDEVKLVKIPTEKLESIIADLKAYQKNVENESEISSKSNQVKED